MIVDRFVHCFLACSSSQSTRSDATPEAAIVVVFAISVLLMGTSYKDNLLKIQ